jgi:hypothetical protein
MDGTAVIAINFCRRLGRDFEAGKASYDDYKAAIEFYAREYGVELGLFQAMVEDDINTPL